MAALVVAGVSVRGLAQAAARDGFEVIALDCFGDLDTRRAAAQWLPIGAGASARIDAARLLDALRAIADAPGREVLGWIAGSGLEGSPDVLARGAECLPLLGTPADAVRRVRDPAPFFATLAAHGIAHPPVRFDVAAPGAGGRWLRKDAAGCGGWHIRVAQPGERVAPGGSRYFQREVAGTPMSATFIANGRGARVVGLNELIVRPRGAQPLVFHGCVGPVTMPSSIARCIDDAVQTLAAAFALRGWCSLDMLIDGAAVQVLEVNPRPPASLALYAARGLIDAQLRACLHAELPAREVFVPARV
ncbi:MAG TPA: ATP-grasp domain-containing protein, partial [Burkholderiaceae bacterium]|nr:ATP-grasp domain-containing protein [Burkholderiaceae bacterium]